MIRLERLCERYGWTIEEALQQREDMLQIFEAIAEIQAEKTERDIKRKQWLK